jgi:hypothetical protein
MSGGDYRWFKRRSAGEKTSVTRDIIILLLLLLLLLIIIIIIIILLEGLNITHDRYRKYRAKS